MALSSTTAVQMKTANVEFEKKHRSKVLEGARIERVAFNPKNKKHRESLKRFIETGNWGDIRFIAEYPHVEVPMTCLVKLAKHHLGAA